MFHLNPIHHRAKPVGTLTLLLFAFLLLMLPASGRSDLAFGTVGVTWDPNPGGDTAGYKVYYGTQSGVYTGVIDVGLSTEFEVPDLMERQVYYCAVTAYGPSGLESGFSEELLILFEKEGTAAAEQPGLILLEVGSEPSETLATESSDFPLRSTSGSAELTGPVSLSFATEVEANYTAWLRMMATTAGDHTYFVSLDGGTPSAFQVQDASVNEWVWHRADLSAPIAAGLHTLQFQTSGSGLMLDRVVLSTSASFVPSDNLPRKGDVVSVISQPSGQTASDGSPITLRVEAVATGPLHYQWVKNGLIIPGETGSSLNLGAVTPEDAGSYSVNLWSGSAIVVSNAAVVVIAPKFKVTRMTLEPGNRVTFEFSGTPGELVEVEVSENLRDWSVLGTFSNISGAISISDPEAESSTQRFYRLRSPSP